MNRLEPASNRTTLVEELLAEERPKPQAPPQATLPAPEQTLFNEMVQRLARWTTPNRASIETAIVTIDRAVSAQLNAILHVREFQALERAWRSLELMVERMDFRENIELSIFNTTKEELLEDFEESYPITTSSLYDQVYTSEYGSHGGKPFALLCANFEVGPGAEDIMLLRNCAAVAAMAHVPIITNAAPSFFGEDSLSALPEIQDLESLLAGPQFAQWKHFRKNPDARNVGLCLPRFLLRLPYGDNGTPVRSFSFQEDSPGHHERQLWGYASALFSCRVADSFAKYRWCPNITGATTGGTVKNLLHPTYETMGTLQTQLPVEIQITESREFSLSQAGFVSLVYRKRDRTACFFSASSVYSPEDPNPEDMSNKLSQVDRHVVTQLPYLFLVTRIAHYIKTIQRERLGAWSDASEIERNLNNWIRQYVADMETPGPAIRARRPLRKARLSVYELEDEPGWFRSHIEIQPHFKYLGADFSLSLVSKLEG